MEQKANETQHTGTHWRWEKDGHNIVWLACDKAESSANVLSAAVL